MTATGNICKRCSKLYSMHRSMLRGCAFSTSLTRHEDEDKMKTLELNPYFSKYSHKISELQKTTPDEMSHRIVAALQKKSDDRSKEKSTNKTHQCPSFTKKSSLNDIVNMELFADKSAEEITTIWLNFHASKKDTISAVISAEVYNLILKTSSIHPTFLLPLPRETGYEFYVTQSCGHEFHLTPLINYQAFKENAPETLALHHFTELSDTKGLVLMKGEYNSEILDGQEALCLTNQLHRYYGHFDQKRMGLLERFTNTPSEFHHMDLIVELEKMASSSDS